MSDLDAFFKKKAERKKKSKKGAVMDLSSIASHLERAEEEAELEAREREREEAEQKANAGVYQEMRKAGEDSDWHDYVEQETDLASAGIKVKKMDADAEAVEEEEKREEEEKEAASNVVRKTWVTGKEKKEDEGSDSEAPPPPPEPKKEEPKQKSSYVAPAQRRANMGWGANTTVAPDLANAELFPSLEDADQKAKEQEAELKKMEFHRTVKASAGPMKGSTTQVAGGAAQPILEGGGAWTVVGQAQPAATSDGKYRPGALRGAMGVTGSAAAAPSSPLPSRTAAAAPTPAPTVTRTPGVYVVPTSRAYPPANNPTSTAAPTPAPAPPTNKYVPPSKRQAQN